MWLSIRVPFPFASAILVAFSLLAGGCSESADQAILRRKKEYNVQDQPAAKYSGTVTIDGQTPDVPAGHDLLVFLYDPKTDADKRGRGARYSACKRDGSFQFGESIAPGSYVVLFAELRTAARASPAAPISCRTSTTIPTRTRREQDSRSSCRRLARRAHCSNLEIAGKEPVTTPGPHAFLKAGGVK